MPEVRRTLLGFDYGSKRIGIAIAEELTGTASPLITLNAKKNKPDWESITKIIEEWQPELFIIGLPLQMDGSEQPITRAAKRFANQLNGRYHIPIVMVDERLSSDEAETQIRELSHSHSKSRIHSVFPGKSQVDMIAAQLILQSWMSQQMGDG